MSLIEQRQKWREQYADLYDQYRFYTFFEEYPQLLEQELAKPADDQEQVLINYYRSYYQSMSENFEDLVDKLSRHPHYLLHANVRFNIVSSADEEFKFTFIKDKTYYYLISLAHQRLLEERGLQFKIYMENKDKPKNWL